MLPIIAPDVEIFIPGGAGFLPSTVVSSTSLVGPVEFCMVVNLLEQLLSNVKYPEKLFRGLADSPR